MPTCPGSLFSAILIPSFLCSTRTFLSTPLCPRRLPELTADFSGRRVARRGRPRRPLFAVNPPRPLCARCFTVQRRDCGEAAVMAEKEDHELTSPRDYNETTTDC